MKLASDQLRTWVEIDAKAARKNLQTFRKLTGPRVAVWSVVKSNAYGHGLFTFAKLMDEAGIDGFCVDSIVEALANQLKARVQVSDAKPGTTVLVVHTQIAAVASGWR